MKAFYASLAHLFKRIEKKKEKTRKIRKKKKEKSSVFDVNSRYNVVFK